MESTKKMNYSVEFFRFMFAINFVMVHSLMVYPLGLIVNGFPLWVGALDNILPFMLLAGFFLMAGYKKEQRKFEQGTGPDVTAWGHLKSRFIGMGPAFLIAQLAGFIAINIFFDTPLLKWPLALVNAIGDILGFTITGIGMGNGNVGLWATAPATKQILNPPLWFISGIFVCGYLVYFLLKRYEKVFLGFIVPLMTVVFYGSSWLNGVNPFWGHTYKFGDLTVAQAFPHMFIGLSLGCLLWVAVDRLKAVKWSKGMVIFLTIVQLIATVILFFRTWASVTSPIMIATNIDWGSVHLWSLIFTFLLLLQVDGVSKFYNWKIWKIPGRMAFYIYMFHYPILVLVGKIMKINSPARETLLPIALGITVVITLILSYGFLQLQTNVLKPWLTKKISPEMIKETAAEG